MRKDTLIRFRKIFETQRDEILHNTQIIHEDFSTSPDDRYDEVDQAALDIEQSMRLRLRNRQALLLKKIEQALERIADGTFGQCFECDESIEVKRLEARPTATLCVTCKEEQERRELQMAQHPEQQRGAGFSYIRRSA